MKQKLISLSVALFLAQFCLQSPTQAAPEKGWEKVFGCEFDSPEDLKKWNVIDYWSNANNEQQAYVADAVSVHDGCLFLTAERRDITYDGKDRHYVSGKLDTNKKFDIQYGRFDCRFKVPKGKGMWPAFWLLPSSGKWPPEIDWMEILGHQPGTLYTTVHYGVHSKGNHPSFGKSYKARTDFSKTFHNLSGYWTKDKITCFVDGRKVYESSKGVPHEKMYVILNLAVGGDWPGMPNASTKFPGALQVDYVRVYKKAGGR